jgi:hypothetical protein
MNKPDPSPSSRLRMTPYVVAALTLIAVIRVASTHRVFSATLDEPIHLAAGYEWFDGTYRIDPTHPPVARILFALPLRGLTPPTGTNMIDRGNQLLYEGDHYEKNLARGRMGNLVFLLVACIAVAAWARHLYGDAAAIIAVALFTNVPPILGHAGLMTTDMSIAATLPLALYALERDRKGFFLGFAVALGVLSKLSFFVYFPVCAIALWSGRLLAARIRRAESPPLHKRAIAIAGVVTFVVAWAGYRFEFGRPVDVDPEAPSVFETVGMPRALAFAPLPAPSLPVGFARVRLHDRGGHTAFLLGKQSRTGWWYYFPVVFFFKTPLPLLILFAFGVRRAFPFALIAAAIMLVAMTASLNIGLRHILPIYAPFCIVAAVAVQRMRLIAIPLIAWLMIGVAIAHPDYLAWFNELAGRNPAHVAVDSNLDWGQDILRLGRVVKRRNIDHLWIVMNNNTRLDRHGIPAEWLPPRTKVSGWVAAGENWTAFTDEYDWLKAYRPVQRVGRSIRLYHIP